MKISLILIVYALLIGGITLGAGEAWASTTETVLPVSDEAPPKVALPPTPVKADPVWNKSTRSEWETRLFDNPLSHYNFSKSQVRTPIGSGIPLKAPGKLPGISFDIEMHSFGALQSVVPPERWSKSFNSPQDQPLLVSPSNISPDYNGGFLRFSW